MFLWGKCKELQRKGWVNQVFCLGAVITVRITENGPTNNILHKKVSMVRQECPRESVEKIISLSSLLLTSGSIAQTFDFCQLHFNKLVLYVSDIVIS